MSDTRVRFNNPHLVAWTKDMADLAQPDRIVLCDGSEEQKRVLQTESLTTGTLIELNQEKLPGCYLHRSDPDDVARTEHLTFICSPTKDEAGPTNNWLDPIEAQDRLRALTLGGMKGRTNAASPGIQTTSAPRSSRTAPTKFARSFLASKAHDPLTRGSFLLARHR